MTATYITLSNRSAIKIPFDVDAYFKKVLALKKINSGQFDITFLNKTDMQSLNKKHLNHDYVTDSITFNLSSSTNLIGDLYISPEKAAENAQHFNVSLTNELQRLLIHGLLHLLGYQDDTKPNKDHMFKEQEYILNKLIP